MGTGLFIYICQEMAGNSSPKASYSPHLPSLHIIPHTTIEAFQHLYMSTVIALLFRFGRPGDIGLVRNFPGKANAERLKHKQTLKFSLIPHTPIFTYTRTLFPRLHRNLLAKEHALWIGRGSPKRRPLTAGKREGHPRTDTQRVLDVDADGETWHRGIGTDFLRGGRAGDEFALGIVD